MALSLNLPKQRTIFRLRKSLVVYAVCNGLALAWCSFSLAKIDDQVRLEQREYLLGDGMEMFITTVPVFAVCLLVNVALAVQALVGIYRRRDYSALITLGAVVAAWILFVVVWRCIPHPAAEAAQFHERYFLDASPPHSPAPLDGQLVSGAAW